MVNCPNCDAIIELDEEELDEGDTLTCEDCGADLTVASLDPLELESAGGNEDEEEEEEEDDFDYDEDEEEEEEEDEEEDWH
jgi:alpha-aminoadipate/glutamate carrier protein LysW